jgi:hypothetical protein
LSVCAGLLVELPGSTEPFRVSEEESLLDTDPLPTIVLIRVLGEAGEGCVKVLVVVLWLMYRGVVLGEPVTFSYGDFDATVAAAIRGNVPLVDSDIWDWGKVNMTDSSASDVLRPAGEAGGSERDGDGRRCLPSRGREPLVLILGCCRIGESCDE